MPSGTGHHLPWSSPSASRAWRPMWWRLALRCQASRSVTHEAVPVPQRTRSRLTVCTPRLAAGRAFLPRQGQKVRLRGSCGPAWACPGPLGRNREHRGCRGHPPPRHASRRPCRSGWHAAPERVKSRVNDQCPTPGNFLRQPKSPTATAGLVGWGAWMSIRFRRVRHHRFVIAWLIFAARSFASCLLKLPLISALPPGISVLTVGAQ
jgi:hypothetical protein